MIKKATIVAAMCLLAVATVFAIVNNGSDGNKGHHLPQGKWAISASPYVGPMYESQPVKVIGVVSDTTKGFRVTAIGLKNTSSKAVASVTLTWYVSSDQSGNAVLLQNKTGELSLTGRLPVGKSDYFDLDVVSFGNVSRPLLKNGALQGTYRIEVAVTDIVYEDGSVWSGDPKNAALAHRSGLRPGPVPQGCAGQMCQYDASANTYRCVDGANQLCTNCGRRCINSICGELAPQCGPGGGN
jgi:hypothetical protein